MTLLVNDVEMNIQQGTPAAYLAERYHEALQRFTCIVKALIFENLSTASLRLSKVTLIYL